MNWISVEDKLPCEKCMGIDIYDEVLIYFETNEGMHIDIGFINEDDDWFITNNQQVDIKVTHWMPLPEPPKDE